jgi:hypothetical protein
VLQGTTYGDTPNNLIQVAADTEVGEFYVDGSGNVTFRHRSGVYTDTRSTVVQAVLGDRQGTAEADGTELPYTLTLKNTDDTTLFNDVQNTRTGGTLQEATDQASVSRFGGLLRTYARVDPGHHPRLELRRPHVGDVVDAAELRRQRHVQRRERHLHPRRPGQGKARLQLTDFLAGRRMWLVRPPGPLVRS